MSEKELQRPKKEKVIESKDPKPSGTAAISTAIDLPPFPSAESPEIVKTDAISLQESKSPQKSPSDIPSQDLNIKNNASSQSSSIIDDSPEIESESFSPFPSESNGPSGEKVATEVYSLPVQTPIAAVTGDLELLTELEREILEVARSILKKKKFESTISVDRIEMMSPLVEELFSKCIAKLTHTRGFPKEDIFKAIQNLEKKLWIVTEQRRTKEEIINNPVLQRVLIFVHTHPGTHARDPAIETELGISRNPFIKHITILEAFGLIRSKKIGRTQNYFSSTVPEIFDDFVVLFENPLVPQIIQLILDNPTINLSELARRLNVYHGAIQYHLKTLMDMNILLKSENFQINKELLRRYNQLYKVPPFRM